MGSNEKALLRTLAYSSVFQFPLTEEELFYYFIGDHVIPKTSLHTALENLDGKILKEKGLFALPDQEVSISKRVALNEIVSQKLSLARRFAQLLGKIPTVYFIGISGSVGVGQAEEDDDIDLFIITKKHSLFVTRLFILMLLSLYGKRRKRQAAKADDLFCVNMILDEQALSLATGRNDIYTAHEVAQIYPLFERNQMYQTFLRANTWVLAYLPHSVVGRDVPFIHRQIIWTEHFFSLFEPLARWFQMALIRRHKTREIVQTDLVAFHPTDYRAKVLTAYEKQLQLYEKYYNTNLLP